jgi:hypothetical protein
VQIGYVLDNITTVRILNYYKKWPSMFLRYQVLFDFMQHYMKYLVGETLSFNFCLPEPSTLNHDIIEKVKFIKLASGGSFLICLDDEQRAWAMG